MLAAIRSAAVLGIEAYDVTVEVDAAQGLPQWTIVGLPAGAVKESRERVSAALVNSGIAIPPRRITVNLAPAHTRKEGTALDLPIALGLLVAIGALPQPAATRAAFLAELGLDGALRPVRGVLPVARHLARTPAAALVVAPGNAAEAALVRALHVAAPRTLAELLDWLRRGTLPAATLPPAAPSSSGAEDLADVVGQDSAKRALEVAAAGAHNLLLHGPPGAGKTMLARRLPGILPALGEEEALEATAIHSVAGLLAPDAPLLVERPFRAPHHTISTAGLIGGGSGPRPGEVSLAHHGVLFLDELLELPRHVLDAMRQPLEDGRVVIARAASAVAYPARFTLVGAMNPCPCGFAGDPTGRCSCSAADIERYRARLSGPLADRIDMHVPVAAVPVAALARGGGARAESSASIRARVERARAAQRARYAALPGVTCNAHAPARWLAAHAAIDDDARALLGAAAERLSLSARAYHRVMRVARTIADLDERESISARCIAEALRYRPAARAGPGAPARVAVTEGG